jgi:hypothetical protein
MARRSHRRELHVQVRLSFAIGILVAGLAASSAGAEPQASRVVDRTLSCQAGFVGGLHQVTVGTTFGTRPGSSILKASAYVQQNMFESLGNVWSDGLAVHRGHCAGTRKNVALTTKGLRGGTVSQLGARATCETPRRILLRVRAVSERLVSTRITRRFGFPQLVASGDLELAAIAIGTPAGKPIAYLSVTGAEKARLFTLQTCEED